MKAWIIATFILLVWSALGKLVVIAFGDYPRYRTSKGWDVVDFLLVMVFVIWGIVVIW